MILQVTIQKNPLFDTKFLASIMNHYFTHFINMTKQIQTVLAIY